MKKILMLIFLILILSGCSTAYPKYHFAGQPINHIPNKEHEYMKYIYIYGGIMDEDDERSSLSYVVVAPNKYEVIDGKAYRSKFVEVLSNKVKVVYKGKEYYLPVSKDNIVIKSHSGGIKYNWNIPLERQVVRLDEAIPDVTDDGLEIYFGKVKVDGTRIIDVPPVKFKKYIKVTKYIPILDGLNKETYKTIYSGPLEDYKKKK